MERGRLSKGERIPTLAEVLDVLPPDKWFFLEIKDSPRIVPAIARILKEKKANPDKVVLISFSKDVVRACREQMPDHRSCWISTLKDFELKADTYLKTLSDCDASGLLFEKNAPVTAEWLKKACGPGGLAMAWTVDDVESARRVAALGADFIGTNRPGYLRTEMSKVH